MSEYVQLVETSPEIALYRSRSLALITEVVERAFRGDNASRIGYRDMVRIIRTVIEEFRDASGDPNALNRAPEAYLKDWIGGDRNLEDGLWFLRDQDQDGDWVRLHGHARRVIEQVMALNTPFRSFGVSTMHDLFRKVLDSSARMDGNRDRMLTNARAERDRIDRQIAELESGAELPDLEDADAESSAREILKIMSELRVGIAEVPDLLRRINRENRETMNRSEGRVGDLIREVLERGRAARQNANGYQFVREVYRLHLDEDRSRDLDLAIRTILDRVAPLLSRSETQRMSGFLRELQLISVGIEEQDYVDLQQQLDYLDTSIFRRNLHEGRIMSRTLDTMYRVRAELNPTIRDTRLSGLGLKIDQPLSLLQASGFRLSDAAPATSVKHYRVPSRPPVDDPERRERAMRAAEREAMADQFEIRRSLELILADTASHVCVDEAGFGSARGRAVTRSGAVQSGTRAEKDDRRRVDDPSGWVLGWSVEPRRQALLKKVGGLEAEVARMRDTAEQAKAGISTHRGRVSAIDVLSQVLCPHSEIDRSGLRTGLERLEAELDRILSGDLRRLEERKTDLIRSQNELRARISQLDKKIGSVESVVRAKRADLASAQDAARKLPRPGVEVRRAIPGLIARLAEMCGVADGTGAGRLSGIAALEDRGEQIPWDRLITQEEDAREKLIRSLARAREGLNNLMMQARREFPEERHLSDQVFDGDRSSEQAMEDWILAEQDLRSQGIPELEGEYRARLDQVSGQAIGQINLAISTYRKEALSSIEKLNEILLKVVYNPSLNSCAQFRIRRVSDPVITAFEADLKTATGQVLNEDPDLSAVQRVIDRIREQDDPKRRADRTRLIDLANWYQVDVEELERLPDGGAGDRINLFDGPTAQSGGQKQRLMAVMFGVGVAHMFGIHEERMSENALRVMILDEAFSQLDPQGTQAAATLLRELGLQVILASPMTKIHAVSGVVSRMQLVSSDEGITRVEPVLMRAHLDWIDRLRDGRNAQALAMLEEGAV